MVGPQIQTFLEAEHRCIRVPLTVAPDTETVPEHWMTGRCLDTDLELSGRLVMAAQGLQSIRCQQARVSGEPGLVEYGFEVGQSLG
jgi:hypothetical protein